MTFQTWQHDPSVNHLTQIQWTHVPGYIGASWNPLIGCEIVSPGCTNCYAMQLFASVNSQSNRCPHDLPPYS